MQQKYYWIFGIIVLIGIIFISGCVQKETIQSGKTTSPLKIEMNMLQNPKLNDVVDVQIKIALLEDSNNRFDDIYPTYKNYPLQVEFVPSDGFEYVVGDFQYTDKEIGLSNPRNGYKWFADSIGSVISEENKLVILNAKIKAIKVGENWEVVSDVLMPYVCEDCPIKVTGQDGASDVLFVSFDETSGDITRERPGRLQSPVIHPPQVENKP